MKKQNPHPPTLPLSRSRLNGLPLCVGEVFFMEKPQLKEDLGYKYATEYSKQKTRMGVFICECGKEFVARISSINTGNTVSCGCASRELKILGLTKHGMSNGGTRLYTIWSGMKTRCFNENHNTYKRHGGRGITMCDEWKDSYLSFYDWANGNGYSPELQIDRINNDGNYEPSNCWWATRSQNMQNRGVISIANTSGYRGIVYSKGMWIAAIRNDGTTVYLGSFLTKEEAALAYNRYVVENNTRHPLNTIKHNDIDISMCFDGIRRVRHRIKTTN